MRAKFKIFLAIFLAAYLAGFAAYAQIMLHPQRLYFGDRDRTSDINIRNTSNAPALFRVELYYLRQTESGSYEEVAGPLDPTFDPATAIVYSPKQVKLPGQGQQRIRVTLRRPPDLPDGEYRAHLRLKRIAQPPQEKPPSSSGGSTATMTINIGFSVPVIVRQGRVDSTAGLEDIKLVPAQGEKQAMMTFKGTRTGKYSTLGNVKVFWTPPGGAEKLIGTRNNFNIYRERDWRTGRVPLTENNIPNGKLRVIYEGDGPDKGKIFDEKIFPVGG